MRNIVIFILFMFYLDYSYSQVSSDTTFITHEPVNLKEVNSSYDDYNSCISIVLYMYQRLLFSTNRFSKEKNFDLISYRLDLLPVKQYDNIYKTTYSIKPDTILSDINEINTDCNEFGPYYKKFDPTYYGRGIDSTLFFITRDCNDNLDIFYAKYQYDTYLATHERLTDFQGIDFINTSADEGYLSISNDFMNIYYCSNSGGNFDIYSVSDTADIDVYQILKGKANPQIQNISEINSEFDDKCPFIHWNDWIVFTSNRKGGFGGYDLYYSERKNGIWSEPKNFGDKINSEFDEYRPIIIEGKFMIFSSNRPQGLGGFDLYIVEIDW